MIIKNVINGIELNLKKYTMEQTWLFLDYIVPILEQLLFHMLKKQKRFILNVVK